MPELPHDSLVSPAAKERWIRWRTDLQAAERKARKSGGHPSCWKIRAPATLEEEKEQERLRREHTTNMLQGYPSLARPVSSPEPTNSLHFAVEGTSPIDSDPFVPQSDLSIGSSTSGEQMTPASNRSEQLQGSPLDRPSTIEEASRNAFINSTQKVPTISQYRDSPRVLKNANMGRVVEDTAIQDAGRRVTSSYRSWGDASGEDSDSASSTSTTKLPDVAANIPLPDTLLEKHLYSPTTQVSTPLGHVRETAPLPPGSSPQSNPLLDKEDCITDTVGAIAVDGWGNIACAASSGGIGMKYRGRVGPAALVGVGTAVVPIEPDDPDRTCVATVTSGTGEHMATTMAATVCAERLYQNVKKGREGEYFEVTEDEALKAMIENDFMGKLTLVTCLAFFNRDQATPVSSIAIQLVLSVSWA